MCKTTEVDSHAKKSYTTCEKYATLISLDKTGGGFFRDKDLRDSQLSQLMR